ncbi:MAG: FGGY family carbohydrate kinase [Planctomycetota bacterium]|jgi:L-fuculokinase
MPDVVLVVDCGATNVTAAAVDAEGRVLASVSEPNGPVPQQGGEPGWLVWDLDALYETVCGASRRIVEQVEPGSVAAVTVATWGADGAPVTASGRPTYPVISWQCPRTGPTMRRMCEQLGERRLFNLTGYQAIRFNTLFKLGWLREHAPEALDGAETWLMVAGLLSRRLCGEPSLDVTGASTTMMLDLAELRWAPELLGAVGLDESFFPELIWPGEVIGALTAGAAGQSGLREGTPVVAAGHDTQFAPIGSGAAEGEAVLSTGTWEIAMLRTPEPVTSDYAFEEGLLSEADAVPGLYDPQLLMMGSGVLEWVRQRLYPSAGERGEAYEAMIEEARGLAPGSDGVMVVPSFVPDTGPFRKHGTAGTIVGLGLTATRAHLYRAALEGLCFQLREALRILGEATGFRPERVRVVGGGARNELWNQMRADVCGMPVVVTERREATIVGAAIAAWVGAGRFESIPDGQRSVPMPAEVIEPSEDAGAYEELFERFRTIPPGLSGFYRC